MTAWTCEEEQRRKRRQRILRGLLLGGAAIGLPAVINATIARSARRIEPTVWGRRHRYAWDLADVVFQRLGRGRSDRPAAFVRPRPRLARVAPGGGAAVRELPGLRPRLPGLGPLRTAADGARRRALHRVPARLPRRRRAAAGGARRLRPHRRLCRPGGGRPSGARPRPGALLPGRDRPRERGARPQGRRHPPPAEAADLRHLGDEPLHDPQGHPALPRRGGLLRPRTGDRFAGRPPLPGRPRARATGRRSPPTSPATSITASARRSLRLSTPTLLVWGREAANPPVESADLWLQAIESAELEVLEGAGTLPHNEAAVAFAERDRPVRRTVAGRMTTPSFPRVPAGYPFPAARRGRARALAARGHLRALGREECRRRRVHLLRGPADRQQHAARRPRPDPGGQGPLPALPDHARQARRQEGRLGHPRARGRDRSREAAGTLRQARHRADRPRRPARLHRGLQPRLLRLGHDLRAPVARHDRARRLLGRSRRRLLHLLEPLHRVGLVGVGRALRQEAPLRGAQGPALLRPLRHDALLARGRAELQGDRGSLHLGALPGPPGTAPGDRRRRAVRSSRPTSTSSPGRRPRGRCRGTRASPSIPASSIASSSTRPVPARASSSPTRIEIPIPYEIEDRGQAPEARPARPAGARAVHRRSAPGSALRPPLPDRTFRRARRSPTARRSRRPPTRTAGWWSRRTTSPPPTAPASCTRRPAFGADDYATGRQVRPAALQDGRGGREDRGAGRGWSALPGSGSRKRTRRSLATSRSASSCSTPSATSTATRSAGAATRRSCSSPSKSWFVKTTAHPRPVGGQEPDDRLAPGGDRQGPLRQLARGCGRLGALPQALLGHAAADLEVRPLPLRTRLFFLYRALPRGRQEGAGGPLRSCASSIRIGRRSTTSPGSATAAGIRAGTASSAGSTTSSTPGSTPARCRSPSTTIRSRTPRIVAPGGKFAPADFISEAVDQTRGWFYTLHVLACALFDSVAFEHCIVMGHVNDDQGRKMSKRLGNVVDPMGVIAETGADAHALVLLRQRSRADLALLGEARARGGAGAAAADLERALLLHHLRQSRRLAPARGARHSYRRAARSRSLDPRSAGRRDRQGRTAPRGLSHRRAGEAPRGLRRRPEQLVHPAQPRPLLEWGSGRRGRGAGREKLEQGSGLPDAVHGPDHPCPPDRSLHSFPRRDAPRAPRAVRESGNAPASVHLEDWPEPTRHSRAGSRASRASSAPWVSPSASSASGAWRGRSTT